VPNLETLTPGDATGPYHRTATQDAINRSCLLAQTRHFRSSPVGFEQSGKPDLAQHEVCAADELDSDSLAEMSRLPIRSNFRVLARISQLLRDFADYA
jgi:hypothetical protein